MFIDIKMAVGPDSGIGITLAVKAEVLGFDSRTGQFFTELETMSKSYVIFTNQRDWVKK